MIASFELEKVEHPFEQVRKSDLRAANLRRKQWFVSQVAYQCFNFLIYAFGNQCLGFLCNKINQ